MTKTNLIDAVAEKAGIKKVDAEKAVNAVFAVIEASLVAGDKVQVTGFGSFDVKSKPAHTGRNPRTGETIEIAASKAPTFSAGKTLRDAVNA